MIQGPRSENPKAGVPALSLTSQVALGKALYLLGHSLLCEMGVPVLTFRTLEKMKA